MSKIKLDVWVCIIIFLFMVVYFSYRLGTLRGVFAERESKICVSEFAINQWTHTLEIAEAICVDVQKIQIGEIKNNYTHQLEMAEEKTKQWKNSYYWCEERISKLGGE